jgi:hypothetical protein
VQCFPVGSGKPIPGLGRVEGERLRLPGILPW